MQLHPDPSRGTSTPASIELPLPIDVSVSMTPPICDLELSLHTPSLQDHSSEPNDCLSSSMDDPGLAHFLQYLAYPWCSAASYGWSASCSTSMMELLFPVILLDADFMPVVRLGITPSLPFVYMLPITIKCMSRGFISGVLIAILSLKIILANTLVWKKGRNGFPHKVFDKGTIHLFPVQL